MNLASDYLVPSHWRCQYNVVVTMTLYMVTSLAILPILIITTLSFYSVVVMMTLNL
jgi:hypothetical protein